MSVFSFLTPDQYKERCLLISAYGLYFGKVRVIKVETTYKTKQQFNRSSLRHKQGGNIMYSSASHMHVGNVYMYT